jgi:ABC-2 type transport system ATP-binding protein
LISVKNVFKNYKSRKALKDISFEVMEGEVLGIIGPNGAGKTTLISLLATINKPEAGKISIRGADILKSPDSIRKQLGYVPQETALYPMLTANENLDFWGGIYGLEKSLKKEKIDRVLKLLKLDERKNDKVKTFSGGMKKRLNIAASLLHDPEILIMDEPTAGVDLLSRATIAELIQSLKKAGHTIIIASHHIDELEVLCDKVLVLREGSLLYSGPVKDILKAAGTDNLEQLMLRLEED